MERIHRRDMIGGTRRKERKTKIENHLVETLRSPVFFHILEESSRHSYHSQEKYYVNELKDIREREK